MKKNNVFLIIILVIVLGVVFVGLNFKTNSPTKENKISVISTLFPQYNFAKEIGGDKVEVTLLLPPGIEAHAYEPKPSDIVKINNAQIFIYTGEFMEPWAHDITEGADKKIKTVDASVGIEMIKKETEHEHEEIGHHHAETKEGEHHHHSGVDPHIWLDFNNAKIMAKNIANGLIEVDPQNIEYYQANLVSYQTKLDELNNDYNSALSFCKSKTIIYGGHYAFGYLAKKYGLKYKSAQGFSPNAEPTAKDLISLVEQIKKDNIKHIFYEELTTSKIAETLANETKTKLLPLNAAHNLTKKNYQNNVSFISIMRENLENLKIGLECKE